VKEALELLAAVTAFIWTVGLSLIGLFYLSHVVLG
jgi:hypothetical protein